MSSARTRPTGGASARSSRPVATRPAGGVGASASARSGGSSRPSASARSSARPSASSAAPAKSSSISKQAAQPSLLESVQNRFVKDVFETAATMDPGWKILIVDNISMKVISAAVGMYDIMERKITLVEALEKKRAPFKDMGAIYILAPTVDSVQRLLDDFSDKSKILYGNSVFVYFLGPIPPRCLDDIKRCKHLIKRLKALSEINVDFLVRENRAYTLDVSAPFGGYYVRTGGGPAEVPVAEKLVSICATLNEYPYIRYKQTSGICSSLATLFKMKMDEFVSKNPTWWYHGSGKGTAGERERSTMLLLDRANDCLTPLMHDFTYQPMVQDLLTMDGDKITYAAESAEDASKKEDKDVLLNEKDSLWVEMRGKHIAEVIEILSGRIKEICKSSTSSAFSGPSGGNMSLAELASALKELPEYREVMSKLSQHMHISHECMDVLKRDALLDLSDIEQTLATGKDEDGRAPKMSEMISRVEGSLLRMREVEDRLRLVLIATISQNGLSSADRDRLLRAAQLGRDELLVLDSLSKLGIQTLNNMGGGNGGGGALGFFASRNKVQNTGSFDDESEYASSRYVPPLRGILADMVSSSLSVEEYPSVIPLPANQSSAASAGSARRRAGGAEGSARKKKGATDKWSRTGNPASPTGGASTTYVGGRNLVFMVGGISYSELKVARSVMEKESREIIVGSTKFINPNEFMKDLSTLTN
eukprot:Nitzschia sp. Nitz4//scaffold1_size375055//246150//248451//NITZ4_000296-RA/size375055-processed-gene-0.376-mRNA-1//1//CDS//3329541105//4910//frame0